MSQLQKKFLTGKQRLPPRAPSSNSPSSHEVNKGRQKDYSPLSWEIYYDRMQDVVVSKENRFRVYLKGDSGPVFFFLHGGGFSGLSWSVLSSILVSKIKCQCVSLDIRGHGDTHTADDNDLSIDTMAK
jgi:protein phosphatase methylesterase 1